MHTSHAALFVPLLKKLYNDDLVSDEAIVAWWRSPAARDGSEARGGEAALELRRRAERRRRPRVEPESGRHTLRR